MLQNYNESQIQDNLHEVCKRIETEIGERLDDYQSDTSDRWAKGVLYGLQIAKEELELNGIWEK